MKAGRCRKKYDKPYRKTNRGKSNLVEVPIGQRDLYDGRYDYDEQ